MLHTGPLSFLVSCHSTTLNKWRAQISQSMHFWEFCSWMWFIVGCLAFYWQEQTESDRIFFDKLWLRADLHNLKFHKCRFHLCSGHKHSESKFGRVEQAAVNPSADNQKERMCGEGQCYKIWAWTNNALRIESQALGIWQDQPATNRCIILQHASPQELPSKIPSKKLHVTSLLAEQGHQVYPQLASLQKNNLKKKRN